MKTIRLFGDLEQFKPVWTLDVKTPAEALRAIDVQRDGFLAACDAGQYVAVLVKADQPELSRQVVNDNAHDPWGDEELWILPVVGGEIMAPMVVAAFAAMGTTIGTLAATVIASVINIGLSLAFSAVSNMITSKKKNTTATQQERPENKPSFIADGPVNLTVAGHPHPILVGHVQDCGSMVLSSNYWVEDIPV